MSARGFAVAAMGLVMSCGGPSGPCRTVTKRTQIIADAPETVCKFDRNFLEYSCTTTQVGVDYSTYPASPEGVERTVHYVVATRYPSIEAFVAEGTHVGIIRANQVRISADVSDEIIGNTGFSCPFPGTAPMWVANVSCVYPIVADIAFDADGRPTMVLGREIQAWDDLLRPIAATGAQSCSDFGTTYSFEDNETRSVIHVATYELDAHGLNPGCRARSYDLYFNAGIPLSPALETEEVCVD